MKIKFLVFIIIVFVGRVFSQSKQEIIELAKKGAFNNLSPIEIKDKLQKYGMSESEAIQFAKENNIDISNFQDQSIKTNSIQIPQTTTSQKDIITQVPQQQQVEEVKGLPQDRSEIPKGVKNLEYFGYNIFKQIPEAFEPNAIGPIDPGYLVSPEDVLRLSIWGQVEFQYELTVDKEGKIFIPKLGQVTVSGIALKDLEEKLKKQLSKIYSGLVSKPPSIFLDLSIAKLRPIRVFVMGEVSKPGGYTINSFATVFNALYSVGGPTVNGSLRKINVIRENKVIATVDLYDYLLRGDKSSDVRLLNNDVIFVPVRGKTIAISGEVKRDAIYELKDDENFSTLLKFCGGLKSSAYLKRVQIDRIIPFAERREGDEDKVIVNVDLNELLTKKNKDISLVDLDEVNVSKILDEKRNFVTISGSVWRQGTFELGKIKTLYDLLQTAEGIRPEAYLKKCDIERLLPDSTRQFITVDLEKILNKTENILLLEQDKIRVYSIKEIEFEKTLSISGHIKYPQTIPFHDSISLYDLVFRAGGLLDSEFRKRTFLKRADIFRLNEDKITRQIIAFNLEKLFEDSTYGIKLMPSDEIMLYGVEVEEILDKFVVINGEVKKPGIYKWRTNLDLQSLILESGGFTEAANISTGEVARILPSGLGGDSLAIILYPSIDTIFTTETQEKFYLQHRDNITIKRNPDFFFHQNIFIEGEVKFPGTYSLRFKNETLAEILKRVGGPTIIGYLGGAEFFRNNQRLIIDFEKAYFEKEKEHNVTLQSNDKIIVPRKPNTVYISGEINNPGLYSFIDGDDIENYIERAGSKTDSSDFIILQRPNGENKQIYWYNFSPEVEDGSKIIVTKEKSVEQKVKEIDIGDTVKDVFAILSSAATLVFLILQINK